MMLSLTWEFKHTTDYSIMSDELNTFLPFESLLEKVIYQVRIKQGFECADHDRSINFHILLGFVKLSHPKWNERDAFFATKFILKDMILQKRRQFYSVFDAYFSSDELVDYYREIFQKRPDIVREEMHNLEHYMKHRRVNPFKSVTSIRYKRFLAIQALRCFDYLLDGILEIVIEFETNES